MLHKHLQRVGGAVANAAFRTARALDKGIGHAHQFLSQLSPEARELIGDVIHQRLGPGAQQVANRAAQGVDRYENVRAHFAGGY